MDLHVSHESLGMALHCLAWDQRSSPAIMLSQIQCLSCLAKEKSRVTMISHPKTYRASS